MGALLNRARMTTATTGTGTITLGSASNGSASFAEAGATNATAYSYCIEDGNDFEIGVGTYTSSGTTFSRDTVTLSKISGTAGTTKLTLSGSATIFITARAQEIATLDLAQTYTATQTITPAANTSALVSSGGSLTGANAQSLVSLAQTWNTTGTPTAIDLNVTNTASNAASLLMDLRVGGVSQFAVRRDGRIAAPLIGNDYNLTAAWFFSGANIISYISGGEILRITSGGAGLASTTTFNWNSDLFLARDAANVLAQRNGTNAQSFRVYNTFTDASNHRRIMIDAAATYAQIAFQAAGTGVVTHDFFITNSLNGALRFQTNNASRWQVSAAGNFLGEIDNTLDIGASGTNRPRNLYMGSWIRFAVTTVGSLPAAGTAGQGARMLVTDANATTFQSVVAGGGANIVPVYSDGTSWRIG